MRKIYRFARWLHIYVSTSLFALLVLFSITGLLLNHSDWLEDAYQEGEQTWQLPDELVNALTEPHSENWQPPMKDLQAFIQQNAPQLGKPNDVSIDYEVREILFDYKLPAGYALVVITTSSEVVMEYRQGQLFSIMNDLHKGRHSGDAWSWVIDFSAGLMMLFAMTGILILLQNRKHLVAGLVLTLLGLLTPFLIYWFMVPRL